MKDLAQVTAINRKLLGKIITTIRQNAFTLAYAAGNALELVHAGREGDNEALTDLIEQLREQVKQADRIEAMLQE